MWVKYVKVFRVGDILSRDRALHFWRRTWR